MREIRISSRRLSDNKRNPLHMTKDSRLRNRYRYSLHRGSRPEKFKPRADQAQSRSSPEIMVARKRMKRQEKKRANQE